MKTYNISFSGSADQIFADLLPLASLLKMYEDIKVAHITTDAPIDVLLGIAGVSFVEEDIPVFVDAHGWHLQRISTQFLPLPSEPASTNMGDGSTVYLVDSKVTVNAELEDANIVSLYEDVDANDDGHGTTMASFIVGKTAGVSPRAKLVTVAIPLGGNIAISRILSAFNAILQDPDRPAVSVVNCSWSVPKSQLLDSKIAELQNNGIVVVAAAGNSGVAADTLSPVGLDTVIGVGACDVFDRVINWESGASNWGPEVDIFAPGIDVPVSETVSVSGTSVSAAMVSGVVAQIIAKYPTLSPVQVTAQLIQSSVEDVLFWNEEIYGSTPNRLLQSARLNHADLWAYTPSAVGYYPVQRGSSFSLDISTCDPLTSADYSTFSKAAKHIIPHPWIILTPMGGVTYRLTASPPASLPTGKYIALVNGRIGSEVITAAWIRFGVYDTDPNELNGVAEEQYLVYNTDSNQIQLTAHVDCCSGIPCAKGEQCCTFTGEFGSYVCTNTAENTPLACC